MCIFDLQKLLMRFFELSGCRTQQTTFGIPWLDVVQHTGRCLSDVVSRTRVVLGWFLGLKFVHSPYFDENGIVWRTSPSWKLPLCLNEVWCLQGNRTHICNLDRRVSFLNIGRYNSHVRQTKCSTYWKTRSHQYQFNNIPNWSSFTTRPSFCCYFWVVIGLFETFHDSG